MTDDNHPWCRDVSRDEAIRRAEDAAAMQSIQHRDLPEAVAALTRRVEGLEAVAEAWRQRCEDEADAASVTPPQWRLLEVGEVIQAGDEYQMSDGEWRIATVVGWELRPTMAPHRRREGEVPSVVFDRLTAERDAAIRERDEAIRELHDLAKAVRERESGEECDHSYAAQCREAAAARRLADRMFPAQQTRGWLTEEERGALERAFDLLCDDDGDGDNPLAGTVQRLLARETPPRVKMPPASTGETPLVRDLMWGEAIRAAGGEVEG